MRVPDSLVPLVDQGVIDEVVRPLMSGKEAQVFLVRTGEQHRVAKVYKEATNRSFRNRADYVEGRKTRNTRDQRAMAKRTRFGRDAVETAWRNAEVDAIYRLREAGVRVPEPYDYVDGVLVMELVTGPEGEPALRMVDVDMTEEEAVDLFDVLLVEVKKMLCAGLVHGDLSDFNVLMGPDGPVIIDFPQAVDTAHNRSARKLLVRDVDNLAQFLGRFAPQLRNRQYGEEMWDLYERNDLTPSSKLTGKKKRSKHKADTSSLLEEIAAVEADARRRREALGLPPPRPARAPKPAARAPQPIAPKPKPKSKPAPRAPDPPSAVSQPAEDAAPKRKRRRRRRRGGGGGGQPEPTQVAPARASERAVLDPRDDLDALLGVED